MGLANTTENPQYEIVVYWEKDDNNYVATVPDLPGCVAHGETSTEAVQNANEAAQLGIATAREFGDEIPEPEQHRWVR
jgi:predicted RNase H-like HicB family nuclease